VTLPDQVGRGSRPPLSPGWRYAVWFLLLLFFWSWSSFEHNPEQQSFSYSEFKDKVRADAVERVTLQGDHVSGRLHKAGSGSTSAAGKPQAATPEAGQKTALQFVTTLPPVDDPELMPLLENETLEKDEIQAIIASQAMHEENGKFPVSDGASTG
jgi:cell division protease FtsH